MSASRYKSGDRIREEKYNLGLEEVNVHQFYPVLEMTFGKQLAIINEKPLQGFAEMGAQPQPKTEDDKVTRAHIRTSEDGQEVAADNDGIDEERLSSEQPCGSSNGGSAEHLSSESPADVEVGLFPTAVDEESLEAAKERSLQVLLANDWRKGGPKIVRGSYRVVGERAAECLQTAMRLKDEGNHVGAVTCLTKAINFRCDNPIFFVERGEAYLNLGDFKSAILNYKKACLLATDSVVYRARLAFIVHFLGQALFDLRLFPEALESFCRACEMDPENFGYKMRCISCLAALQRHGECLTMVNEVLEEHKTNPDLYVMRARLNELFANTSLCYQDVLAAINLDPDHSEGQAMMKAIITRASSHKLAAMQNCIKGHNREAVQNISLAIQTNPAQADFHILRGALHRKQKDFNAAVDDFLLAMDKCGQREDDPVFRHAQRQLLLTFNDFAVDCFHKSFYTEAITLLNKALNEEKMEKALYVNRGDCFFRQDELSFALQDYEQALELNPHDASIKFRVSLVHNEFGVRLFKDKSYSEAERKFSLAIELCPLVGHYYVSRCRTRFLCENLSAAREDFLRGLLLSPTSEGITSISSRLFPGRSLADIVNSPVGRDTWAKLTCLGGVPAHLPEHRQYPKTDGSSSMEELSNACLTGPVADPSSKQQKASVTNTGFVMCMVDREFYVRQAHEKKKVADKVKEALSNHRSLRNDGPLILPLSLVSRKPADTPECRDPFLASAAGKSGPSGQSGTHWRNFGLSIARS